MINSGDIKQVMQVAEEKKDESTLLDQVLWVEWIQPDRIVVLTEAEAIPRLIAGNTYPIKDVVREVDLPKVVEHFDQLNSGASTLQFGLKIGNRKTTSINCITLKEGGRIKCLWKIGDIEKNDSLQLLATAAHDLRSPINSIIGLTNVLHLMLKTEEFDSKEFSRMVSMIKTSCNNALNFSEDLLEISEIESINYVLKKESVIINHFVKGFINTHRLVTIKKGIVVKFETELADDVCLAVNKNKLTRALGNLLSNATKFSPAKGAIYFKLKKSNSNIVIQVIDEGVGMPAEIIKNLFVKFGKAQRLGLEGEKSHGLGMSIVKQIVKLHGGKIDVISKEGNGTTVNLTFRIN